MRFLVALTVFAVCVSQLCWACTNFIGSRGATHDSSTLLSYNADSGKLYGEMYSYPARKNIPEGTMREIFDWDSGAYLGSIPEAQNTFNVIGNMNEFGLVIGETTYGGISVLNQGQPGAILDYGNLEWLTLQRAKNAREAIHTLDHLMQTYGYASEGESFSIADGQEAWIMEIIGKGALSSSPNKLGSVWVARKLPEGTVCAHANQARITTFPKDDPNDTLYAPDVITFARQIGLYSGSDADFSFSDTYDPLTFTGARFCEARVWAMFGSLMGTDWMNQYQDYASGYNLTNRMPLFVSPPTKVSAKSLMQIMRTHYETTALDMSGTVFHDIGAANANIPYRTHPLSWSSGGKSYFNERPVATQQTGWNFVATTRSWMPEPLRGVMWFGPDDSSTTAHLPVYGSASAAPKEYAGKGVQNGVVSPMMSFNMRSAFYAFNVVANWVYTRWGLMYSDLYTQIIAAEDGLHASLMQMDATAQQILASEGRDACVAAVTNWSSVEGTKMIDTWNTLFGTLFVKYRDGYVITANTDDLSCACNVGNGPYPQQWYDDVAASTGNHYQIPDAGKLEYPQNGLDLRPKSKESLLRRR